MTMHHVTNSSIISVMVIDAHHMFLDVVTRFLEEHVAAAITIVGAGSGIEEVLLLAGDVSPDVVLLGLSGDVQRALRSIPMLCSIWPSTQIIVLGIFDDAIYEQQALAAGADLFLEKSSLRTTLIPAIHRLVQV